MPAKKLSPQSGITNRPPEHCFVAAFVLDTADPPAARSALDELQRVQRDELRSNLDEQTPATDKAAPGPETGELGFRDGYDRAHLTITTGFGVGAFEKLAVPPAERPQDLVSIPWAQLGDTPQQNEQGDFVLQVCSDDVYVCEHVIRRVEQELAGRVTLLWTQIGSQRYTTRQGRTNREEGRAVTGFIDGTSNLNPRHDDADRLLTFVDPDIVTAYPKLPVGEPPGYGGAPGSAFPTDLRSPPQMEPTWTKNGTYMVVRASTIDTTGWDQIPLGEQEHDVGRFKLSGSFLDLSDDRSRLEESPAFATDQANRVVPVDAHARKANPRRPEDADRRIFRRGYPLIAGTIAGLDRGLVFIAFGRSISTQFEFMFRAWMRNPNFPEQNSGPDRLFRFEKQVIGGGYYFVPPITNPNQPWSWTLPA